MLMYSEDCDEDALFEHGTRASRKDFQKGPNGRHEVVPTRGIMLRSLPRTTVQILNTTGNIELSFGSKLDLGWVLLAA